MFKIKCCTCNNESEITVENNEIKISYGLSIRALDGQLVVECDYCGQKFDDYNKEYSKDVLQYDRNTWW